MTNRMWWGVVVFLLIIIALWAVSPITDYWNSKAECLRYQSATGFETKWVRYRFTHGECMVKLHTPEVEGVKWLPTKQVHVIVTTEVP